MSKIILYIDSMQCGGAQRVMNVIASHYAEIGYETILVNDIVPIDNILEYSIHPAVRRVFLDKTSMSSNKNVNRILLLRRMISVKELSDTSQEQKRTEKQALQQHNLQSERLFSS